MSLLKFQFRINNKFSAKIILNYGIHLGGHEKLLCLETSSIIFGIRTRNLIINLNTTSFELVKVLKILEGIGFGRGVLYFINSILGFRLSFKNSFKNYNRHLFFPINLNIKNVLKNFDLLICTKAQLKKRRKKKISKKKFFFIKSGKLLLRKLFVASKWSHGFVSNSKTFFTFVDNVLHGKIKFGKSYEIFNAKVKDFLDYYPLLPNYGFVGDNRLNFWIVNEFKMVSVPSSSVIDTFTTKALYNMYGIPGNSNSIDSTLFFLLIAISNYLTGFYQHIVRFFLNNIVLNHTFLTFKIDTKSYFFKKFRQIEVLNSLLN